MSKELDEFLLEDDKLKLVFLYADWCGPCQQTKPEAEYIKENYNDKVDVKFFDVDYYTDDALNFNVKTIPSLIFLRNGKELTRMGSGSKDDILEKINNIT